MLSEKFSCCIDWTQTKITTKAYVYLDKKNKSSGLLDTTICKTKIMTVFF